jgi:3-oxoadipate enol-lactonase
MKMYFEDYGEGTPIVFLHAFPLSGKMWRRQIEAITEQGCRLILPDFRGFGISKDLPPADSIEEMAEDIAELLQFLNIGKAIIGGLSIGGYVIFNLYRLHPEIFSALILCDTNPVADTVEKRLQRLETIDRIKTVGVQTLREKMLPNLISPHTKNENPELLKELENLFGETAPASAISALKAMAERKDQTSVLERINVPTALIFGEEDRVTDLQTAKSLNDRIKNSRLFVVKNAGHFSNMEQPEQFNSVLKSFIKEVKF